MVSSRGGGYLVYLSDGDVPFFRVSFSPIFSRTGYQKKANFLEQVVKHVKRGNFVRTGHYSVKFLSFLSSYTSHRFFQERGII